MRRRSSVAIVFLAFVTLLPSAAAAQTATPAPLPEAQRVDLPELGVAASFPAGWSVRTPMMRRASWFNQSDDDVTPVYAWTAVFATAGDGRWCGIDRFEDFPWTFDEHATFLEKWHVSGNLYGRNGGYEPIQLPAGAAYRIDINDEIKERSSTLYLLEYGSDRVLLTCIDVLDSDEDWLSVANSIELGPRTIITPDETPDETLDETTSE